MSRASRRSGSADGTAAASCGIVGDPHEVERDVEAGMGHGPVGRAPSPEPLKEIAYSGRFA